MGGDAPAFSLGMWLQTLCQGKAIGFRQCKRKLSPLAPARSRPRQQAGQRSSSTYPISEPSGTSIPSPVTPGGLRQYSHMSVTCARAQPIGRAPADRERPGPHPAITQRSARLSPPRTLHREEQPEGPAPPQAPSPGRHLARRRRLRATHCSPRKLTTETGGWGRPTGQKDTRGG